MKESHPPVYSQTYLDEGEGPPVVLLHGLFGNLAMWKSTVETLKHEFRVIVPRLPIFDLPVQHTDVNDLVGVLHQFIEWHRLSDVTLVGHAVGGQLALLYTSQCPANVRKVVVVAAAALAEYSAAGGDDTVAVAKEVESASGGDSRAKASALWVNVHSRWLRGSNVASLLNRLDHSTLLVWGLDDRITPPEVALHFFDFLVNSEVKFIGQCGHNPMIEQPEVFNKYIGEFVRKGR